MSSLTQLRSLYLVTNPHPDTCSPEAVLRHIPALGSLSSLTALTSLDLVLPMCYTPIADSYDRRGDVPEAWEPVRQAQHVALLAAFRCMPQLRRLWCPNLWITAAEAASFTNLTSLQLGGLLPPGCGATTGAGAGAGAGDGQASLPPNLRDFQLAVAVSPQVLASLQLPLSLRHFYPPRIQFGMSAVGPDGRILAETVEAVGPAVRQLLSCVPAQHWQLHAEAVVIADWGHFVMKPRADGPQGGHAEWISQLAGLDVFRSFTLDGVQLQAGDLLCLVATLPKLKVRQHVRPYSSACKLWGLFVCCGTGKISLDAPSAGQGEEARVLLSRRSCWTGISSRTVLTSTLHILLFTHACMR